MDNTRMGINLKLNAAEVLKHFKSIDEAYAEIDNFMIKNGFLPDKVCNYVSREPVSLSYAEEVTVKLNLEFHWLKHCILKYEVVEIGQTVDTTHLFKK